MEAGTDVTLASQDGNWTRLCEESRMSSVLGVLGVEGNASLSLTSKDGKVIQAFSTTLGQIRTPLNPPPALSTKAPAPEPPASEPSASWPSSPGPPAPGWPPAPCRTFSSLLDLQLLDLHLRDFQLLDLQLIDLVPYGSANVDRPSKRGTGFGQTSTNPATASLQLHQNKYLGATIVNIDSRIIKAYKSIMGRSQSHQCLLGKNSALLFHKSLTSC